MVYLAFVRGVSVSMLSSELLETFRTEPVCHRVVGIGSTPGALFGRDGQQHGTKDDLSSTL